MPVTGNTTISDCGSIFHGPDLTQSFSIADATMTVCPTTPGTFLSVYFDSTNIYHVLNYLFIYDGSSTNDPIMSGLTGINKGSLITASNASGCLTFKYITTGNYDMWNAVFSCSSLPGISPVYDNRDCYKSKQICSDATFAGNSTSTGINELASAWIPCSYSGEMQSSWYYFRTATPGVLGFTINPGAGVDYDFALWGPYNSLECPINTFDTPIRCSYSAQKGDTGLGNGATDDNEGVSGDKWVSSILTNKDDVYVLYINNYSANSTPYNFIWDLAGGASIDCTPLPVCLSYFEGKKNAEENILRWETLSEKNTFAFELQRSLNGTEFNTITKLKAAGESKNNRSYEYADQNILAGTAYYYRLKQTDLDGNFSFSKIIFINNNSKMFINIFPNPVQDVIYISAYSLYDDKAIIEIINTTGQVVLEKEQDFLKGVNDLSLNTAELPKGIYLFKLSSSSGLLNGQEKLIK